MLRGIGLLLGFQLAGELTVWAFHLPLSGPICGMAALLGCLCWVGRIPDDLAKVADGLLSNMAILFVPIGAGVVIYADLFRTRWPAIVTALFLATFVTLVVTALTARWMGRLPTLSLRASTLAYRALTRHRWPDRIMATVSRSSRKPTKIADGVAWTALARIFLAWAALACLLLIAAAYGVAVSRLGTDAAGPTQEVWPPQALAGSIPSSGVRATDGATSQRFAK